MPPDRSWSVADQSQEKRLPLVLPLLPVLICASVGMVAALAAFLPRDPTPSPDTPQTEASTIPLSESPDPVPAVPAKRGRPLSRQPVRAAPAALPEETRTETTSQTRNAATIINRYPNRPIGTPLVQGPLRRKAPAAALWRAGRPDGYPAHPDAPLRKAEYKIHRPTKTPWNVSADQPFPQTIGPGQAVVLRLRELPVQPLTFELILNRGRAKKSARPWLSARQAQFVQILFNGERLLDRWIQTSSSWQQVYIPAHRIKSGSNTLAIRNMAADAFAVDAAQLRLAAGGAPIYVALAEAEWLDVQRARCIPHMAINTYPNIPPLDEAALDWLHGLEPAVGTPLPKRSRAWKRQAPVLPQALATAPQQMWYRQWRLRLDRIFRRGAEPVLVIRTTDSPKPGWLLPAAVFRHYVQHWQIIGEDPDVLAGQIQLLRQLLPDADISVSCRDRGLWPADLLQQATPALPLLSARHTDERLMRHRQLLLRQHVAGPAMRRPRLQCRQMTGCTDFRAQSARLQTMVRDIVTWLHLGGGSVIINGGGLGGSLFPEAAESPAAAWPVLAPILQLGRGRGTRIPANCVPYDASVGLFDAAWVAVETAADEVALLAYADSDRRRQVQFQIPVPWDDTQARVVIEAVQISRRDAPTLPPPETRIIDTQSNGGRGRLVEIKTRLPSVLRIRLQPAGKRRWQRQQVAADIASPNLQKRPRRFVFSRIHKRLPHSRWLEPLTDWQRPTLDFGALSPAVRPRRCAATPGRIAGIQNVVPWSKQSVMVDFTAGQFEQAAAPAARFRLDAGRFPAATHLLFWVYPRSSDGGASATLIAGTPRTRGKILLRTDRWHCLEVPLKPLLDKQPCQVFWFYVWPYAPDCRRDAVISFEFNAFLAAGRQLDAAHGLTQRGRLVPVGKTKKRSRFLLLGAPGKPVTLYATPDLKTKIRKAFVACEGVQATWRGAPRILQLKTERMPDHCDVPDELLQKLPLADFDMIQRGRLAAAEIELLH